MARVTAANSPIHDHDLAYARYLLDGLAFQPELTAVADSFYDDAYVQIKQWADMTGYTVEQCAAVTALYSMNKAWGDNVVKAHNAIVHGLHNHFPIVVSNAKAILNGAPIADHLTKGPKVNNFYLSLLRLDGCRGANDRWIFRIFNRPQSTTWYSWVDRCLDKLAVEYGIEDVSTLQARLWYAVILDMAYCGDRGAIQSATMLGIHNLD